MPVKMVCSGLEMKGFTNILKTKIYVKFYWQKTQRRLFKENRLDSVYDSRRVNHF